MKKALAARRNCFASTVVPQILADGPSPPVPLPSSGSVPVPRPTELGGLERPRLFGVMRDRCDRCDPSRLSGEAREPGVPPACGVTSGDERSVDWPACGPAGVLATSDDCSGELAERRELPEAERARGDELIGASGAKRRANRFPAPWQL